METSLPPCRECGLVHVRLGQAPNTPTCVRHSSQKSAEAGRLQPCLNWRRKGLRVCGFHGGKSSAALEAGARNVAMEATLKLARTLGGPRADADPQALILEEISWAAGHVEFYRTQVQALDPDALIRGVRGIVKQVKTGTEAGEGVNTETTTTDAGPMVHAWLERYDKERDRLASLCVQAVRLGIEQKRVEQEMQVGRRLAETLRYAHDRVMALVRPMLPSGSSMPEEIREAFVDAIRLMTMGSPFPAVPVVAIPAQRTGD